MSWLLMSGLQRLTIYRLYNTGTESGWSRHTHGICRHAPAHHVLSRTGCTWIHEITTVSQVEPTLSATNTLKHTMNTHTRWASTSSSPCCFWWTSFRLINCRGCEGVNVQHLKQVLSYGKKSRVWSMVPQCLILWAYWC